MSNKIYIKYASIQCDLHGFSYSACLSWIQKKAQYEKYSNNRNAAPIKLIEMKHCKINIELGLMEACYIIKDP